MAVASDYNVELRDKNGNLKAYITPFVSAVDWEWNRIGGCGNCNITLQKGYRDILFDARDDIQIRLKDGATSKLVYRGYIANITPTLQDKQSIKLQIRGYFDLFKTLIVNDSGDIKTYTTAELSTIVDDIIDTFVVGNTPITKGTIDAGTFEADSIQFLNTVENCLATLAELSEGVEYGVDEDLVFFWRAEDTSIKHKFFVGDNITMLERTVKWDNLVNKVYLVGGTVSGSKYKRTGENTDSQDLYYLSETILNNGSVITDTVADQYIGATLRKNGSPLLRIRAKIVNTPKRLEDNIPVGLVTFYDAKYDKTLGGDLVGTIIGEAVDGGDDIVIGLLADGGSDVFVGGQYSAQISRVAYTLSNTPGRVTMTIEFGDTVLDTAATIKRLELALDNIQQY